MRQHTTSPRPFQGSARIGLLTGGIDKPYAIGLASALALRGFAVDFVGSDELDCREVRRISGLTFLNLRGDQREDASLASKTIRILTYYARLVRYVALGRPAILHILWNNKFELLDRTLMMLGYRLAGRRIVLTAHNVNAAKRDAHDSWVNRASLRIQYRLCDHIFVHTDLMKRELVSGFGARDEKVTVIPFGVNNTSPTSNLTTRQARARMGLGDEVRTVLFFGQIAPYKGVEYLVSAIARLAAAGESIHLIIAGKVKRGHEEYWQGVQQAISASGISGHVIQKIGFIPDEEVEQYFKATHAVIVPYVDIFQSGVPFLAYNFGVPVIATDVGSLREDVIDGKTGFICRPRDPDDLAKTIERYFSSELYRCLDAQRDRIRRFACEQHSWAKVGEITEAVYASVLSAP